MLWATRASRKDYVRISFCLTGGGWGRANLFAVRRVCPSFDSTRGRRSPPTVRQQQMVRSPDRLRSSGASVRACGLVYVLDSTPGIRRMRDDEGFIYRWPNGRRVTGRRVLERIAALAIPPAYEDVWICTDPRGHLQATGHDARRRKQYRYHPKWRLTRDTEKFERMVAFGEALPRLRRRLRRDLALPDLPRQKVLAVVVSLLDETRLRVGNATYARENDSYGLTTLRNRHVQFIRDEKLLLRFRGKGGTEQEIQVDDERLVRLVRCCRQLPGQQLFQYVDERGEATPISSDDVNRYLKEAMGKDFTAKDFRTWGATLHATVIMHATPLPARPSKSALNRCIVEATKKVAGGLGNTPAVCRKSYINPLVFKAWRSGELHRTIGDDISRAPRRTERFIPALLRRQALASARGYAHP